MKPFVITGCGMSGTMGMSQLLNNAGIRTAFEEFFDAGCMLEDMGTRYVSWLSQTETAGEVSSLAAPVLPFLQHESNDIAIIHVVRNPVAVLSSLMWQHHGVQNAWWSKYIKFNRRWMPQAAYDEEPLSFYMKYWLAWNEHVEPHAAYMTRIEDVRGGSAMQDILSIIESPWNDRARNSLASYDTQYNHKPRDTSVSWRRIPDGQLKSLVLRKAMQYGYTEAELDGYCPHGNGCAHCGQPIVKSCTPIVSIQPQYPRHMRKEQWSGPPNANYIQGLIDLYDMVNAHDGIAVEVGSWTGESAEIACQFVRELWCVDPWEDPSWPDNEAMFDQRTAAYPNIRKLKARSEDAAMEFEDESVAMVYIDGKHEYQDVCSDIRAWYPKIQSHGWITGHDYDNEHPGVVQAVDDLLGTPELTFSDSSWAVQKISMTLPEVQSVSEGNENEQPLRELSDEP